MTFGSLFAGIGGFDLGFENAGMSCVAQVEIDSVCRSVLGRHFTAQQETDVVRYRYGWEPKYAERFATRFVRPDVLCGGFPCQDLSVAGKRAGLDGNRSGLWFTFRRIIALVRPRWVCIENVPGLLSSNEGRDMGIVLAGLADLGYGWAYRVLDAQWFGVAQRRRRVFIVGSLGDGSAAEILFECESGSGDIAPGGKARAFIAGTIAPGAHPGGFNGNDADRGMLVTHSLTANGHDASEDGTGRGTPIVAAPRVARQAKGGFTDPVSDNIICTTFNGYTGGADDNDAQGGHLVFDWQSGGDVRHNVSGRHTSALQASQTPAVMALHYSHDFNQDRIYDPAGIAPAHNASDSNRARNMATSTGVRRLTPTECERLQGFPDGWTAGQSDSARYRQLGNAVAVPVVKWLGDCIADAGIDRRARAAVED